MYFIVCKGAKKERPRMGTAPVGYTNKAGEDERKLIAPKEPEASLNS